MAAGILWQAAYRNDTGTAGVRIGVLGWGLREGEGFSPHATAIGLVTPCGDWRGDGDPRRAGRVHAHGNPVQHVSLNDGGIWVTDNAVGQVSLGRFAKPIGELAGQVAPKSATSVDVWQNGPLVATFANSPSGGHMYAVDVDQTIFADPAGAPVSPVIPDTGGVALGGDPDAATLAVLGTDHSLRRSVTTLVSGGSLNLDALALTAPVLAKKLPANSAVAVGSDNTTWVAAWRQAVRMGRGRRHARGH